MSELLVTEPLLPALLPFVPLDALPRTGWILRGIAQPESVAGHIVNTCFVVLALGPRVAPALDLDRAVTLALLHDAPEALTGDLPRMVKELLPAGAKAHAEERAARALLGPVSSFAHERWSEYDAGETREARFVKLCDRLQMGVRAVAYRQLGLRGLDDFEVTLRALECGEFAAAGALQSEILVALRA